MRLLAFEITFPGLNFLTSYSGWLSSVVLLLYCIMRFGPLLIGMSLCVFWTRRRATRQGSGTLLFAAVIMTLIALAFSWWFTDSEFNQAFS